MLPLRFGKTFLIQLQILILFPHNLRYIIMFLIKWLVAVRSILDWEHCKQIIN